MVSTSIFSAIRRTRGAFTRQPSRRLGARGCTADDGDVTTKRRCSFGLERHGWPAFRRRVAVGSERYAAVLPPSAANDAPVIKVALADARNTMVWAILSGAPS